MLPRSSSSRTARQALVAASSSSRSTAASSSRVAAYHTSGRATPHEVQSAVASTSISLLSTASLNVSITFALPSIISSLFHALARGSNSGNDDFPPFSLAGLGPSSATSDTDAAAPASNDILNWDGILRAVPKKKVSHSRKAMRAANKGLKDRVDFVHCPSCGRAKASHHLCPFCFGEISRSQKRLVDSIFSSSSSSRGGKRAVATGRMSVGQGMSLDVRGLSAPAVLGLRALQRIKGVEGEEHQHEAQQGEGKRPSWWKSTVQRTVGGARQ